VWQSQPPSAGTLHYVGVSSAPPLSPSPKRAVPLPGPEKSVTIKQAIGIACCRLCSMHQARMDGLLLDFPHDRLLSRIFWLAPSSSNRSKAEKCEALRDRIEHVQGRHRLVDTQDRALANTLRQNGIPMRNGLNSAMPQVPKFASSQLHNFTSSAIQAASWLAKCGFNFGKPLLSKFSTHVWVVGARSGVLAAASLPRTKSYRAFGPLTGWAFLLTFPNHKLARKFPRQCTRHRPQTVGGSQFGRAISQ